MLPSPLFTCGPLDEKSAALTVERSRDMAREQGDNVASLVGIDLRPMGETHEVDEELYLRRCRNGHRNRRKGHVGQEPIVRDIL